MQADEGEVVDPAGLPVGRFACGGLGFPKCPPSCPPAGPCLGVSIHGPLGVGDFVNFALSGNLGHPVGGHPKFDGWPRWDNFTGQQMYTSTGSSAHGAAGSALWSCSP